MRRDKNPNESYFAPWKPFDKFKLALLCAVALFAIVCVTIPVGWVAIGFVYGLVYVWVPPQPTADTYLPDSRRFKLAQFFQAFKMKLSELRNPTILLGFGPPLRDDQHDLDPDILRPPFRLAAWWGVLGAITLGVIDYLINPVLFPFWGGPYLSFGLVMWLLSIPGWFVVIQAVAHIMRWRAESSALIGSSPAPATMMNKVWSDIPPKKVLVTSGSLAFIPVIVAGIAWVIVGNNLLLLLGIALFVSLLIFFGVASRQMTKAYRREWYATMVEPRQKWLQIWQVVRPKKPPQFSEAISIPTKEEWAKTHPNDPYQRKIRMASFLFVADDSYEDLTKGTGISPITKEVTKTFQEPDFTVSTVVLAPMGKVDTSSGQPKEQLGTVSTMGFRLYYSRTMPKFTDIFDPTTDARWREFSTRALVMPILEKVSGGADFIFVKARMATRPNSPQHIAEIILKPPPKVRFETVNKSLDNLISAVQDVPWLRVSRAETKKTSTSESTSISIFLGDRPSESTQFSNRVSGVKARILAADMRYVMAKSGVMSNSFTPPKLTSMTKITKSVSEAAFEMPLGVDTSRVRDKKLWKALGASSGNEYLEIRDEGADLSAGSFVMTMAEKNPLAEVFPFGDYRDELVKGRNWNEEARNDPRIPDKDKPKPWDAWLKWGVGMFSNNKIGWDSFEKRAEPHLLIAGSSGSGKSVCLQSLILQLSVNNSPSDLVFWMVEPKIGLQRFKRMDNVQRFVDSWYPYEDFFESVDEIVEDAKLEMLRRNKVLSQYVLPDGSVPEKLSQGREIAFKEGDSMDEYGAVKPHALKIPYLVLIIEECGTLFADAPSKEDQEKQKRILANCARIAREGRSAGVYLICTTQYPTNASIPSVIRNQMGRIGLACRSRFASEIVIDEAGLEDASMRINKGSGMIMDGLSYRQLRMFWLQDGDTTKGKANDIVDFMGGLPKNGLFDRKGQPISAAGSNKATPGKGKPSAGKKKSSSAPPPRIVDALDFSVPAPSSKVIGQFNQNTVEGSFVNNNDDTLNSKIDSGIATPDVTDDDYDSLVEGI